MNAIKRFINDEDGLTVLEYVIGAGLLVGGLTLIFAAYGPALSAKLDEILTRF